MYIKRKLFLPLVLICTLFVGSFSLASSSTGVSLTNVQRLNQLYIDTWDDLSISDKRELLYQLEPTFLNKLGLKTYLPYETLAQKYQAMYDANLLPDSAKDSNGDYYSNYGEFLLAHTGSNSGYLTYDRYASDVTVEVVNKLAEQDIIDSGMQQVTLLSYKNINSSVFPNLTMYNNFIAKCEEYYNKGFDYVFVGVRNNSSNYIVGIFDGDIYKNGSYYYPISLNGSTNIPYTSIYFTNNGNYGGAQTLNNGSSSLGNNIGTPSSGFTSLNQGVNYISASSNNHYNLYTLKPQSDTFYVALSVSAYLNNMGHYEPTFQFFNNWGRVPSVSMDSHDFTQTYNNIVSGSNNVTDSNNTTTNIYYPGSYVPGSNSYDEDTHKLDFSGVGALLSSIGDLIGSLINGIAQGIANIVSSVSSVVANFTNNIINGSLLGFLKSIFSWLPEPIPSLIIAIFTLSVLFGLIKLVKGIF